MLNTLAIANYRSLRWVIVPLTGAEETQQTLALLKILALGNQQVAQGKTKPLAEVAKRLRSRKATE